MADKYNGWTNYETWNYALWLGNEQHSSEHCDELAQGAWDTAEEDKSFTRLERATLNMADTLKNECEEYAEEWMPKQAGPFADAINSYISEINWYEIAQHYMENIDQDQD